MAQLIRTQIYLPAKLKNRLKQEAKWKDSSFSRVVIEFLEEHLEGKNKSRGDGALSLLRMAERAEQEGTKGPSDLSVNHDYYLYGDGSPKFGPKQ